MRIFALFVIACLILGVGLVWKGGFRTASTEKNDSLIRVYDVENTDLGKMKQKQRNEYLANLAKVVTKNEHQVTYQQASPVDTLI